jgi:hypothetical protein
VLCFPGVTLDFQSTVQLVSITVIVSHRAGDLADAQTGIQQESGGLVDTPRDQEGLGCVHDAGVQVDRNASAAYNFWRFS